uniref:DUF599 domain-containing protein n=1 Tax=Solanum lycopersicum TaxID=4081 RepID=K4BHX7_SOLLC
MEKEILDYVLVPLGLLIMAAYHLWLLQRILKHPTHTVIGINSINRRLWVLAMMEESPQNGVLAVQTLRNNIMASTLLASTAIMLSSLIAVLMTGGSSGRSVSFHVQLVFMFMGIRASFACQLSFFQYCHASILINVPYKKLDSSNSKHCVTVEYVGRTVNRGSYFWSLGLRAFYFSFPLFLWIFGPIPMFLCCIFLVVMLYFLDASSDFGWVAPADENSQQTA